MIKDAPRALHRVEYDDMSDLSRVGRLRWGAAGASAVLVRLF